MFRISDVCRLDLAYLVLLVLQISELDSQLYSSSPLATGLICEVINGDCANQWMDLKAVNVWAFRSYTLR